jgi:hypothetical protein
MKTSIRIIVPVIAIVSAFGLGVAYNVVNGEAKTIVEPIRSTPMSTPNTVRTTTPAPTATPAPASTSTTPTAPNQSQANDNPNETETTSTPTPAPTPYLNAGNPPDPTPEPRPDPNSRPGFWLDEKGKWHRNGEGGVYN